MRLKSIAIRDLAGIARTDLLDLDPGLNILIGDNEAGKSTILTALRAAIFHRHSSNSQAVRDLAPYARNARPEVDLVFELGAAQYRLEKRFIVKPEARLTCGASELVGDAVEDRLAELFGFAPMKTKFQFEEHQGAFGLLWVEQGRSTQGLDLGAGRDAVAASLEAEVGQILGGERGRGMIAASRALRDRHFTATGRLAAGSEILNAEKEAAAIAATLAEKRRIRRALDDSIDRLSELRRIASGLKRDRVVEEAEEALQSAEAAERGLEARRRDVTEAEQGAVIAEGAVERAAGERKRRLDLRAEAEAASAACRAAAARLAEATRDAERLVAAAAPLQAALAAASAERRAGEDALRLAEGMARHGEVSRLLDRLRQQIASALKAAQASALARARLSRGSLDEKGLKAIEAAERARREAAIGRDAAAPLIAFHPDAGQIVTIDGPISPAVVSGAPIRLTQRQRFRLEGFGAIDVQPDEASERREAALGEAEIALQAALRRAGGLADIDAAQRLREETRAAEADLREAEIELKAYAPKGLSALEDEERQLAAELAGLATPAGEAPADLAEMRRAIDAAILRETAARQAHDACRRAESDARQDLARAQSRDETLRADAERLARLLSDSEASASDGALAQRLAAAEMMRSAKAVVLAALRADYEAADPGAIRRDVENRRGALGHARRDLLNVENEIRDLEAEIRQTGGLGLGEEIDRLEAEAERAAERLARLRLEASAANLLFETLRQAEARGRRTWLAPIRREVEPYLRLIHPGTEVAFDDATLALTGLTRGGVEEEFRRLSAGAREQVAVVTRLALAQVLRKGGHPAAVILDDALVNTDEERLKRMHRVLERAAEDLQILILTCRGRDFQGLGAKIFRL